MDEVGVADIVGEQQGEPDVLVNRVEENLTAKIKKKSYLSEWRTLGIEYRFRGCCYASSLMP